MVNWFFHVKRWRYYFGEIYDLFDPVRSTSVERVKAGASGNPLHFMICSMKVQSSNSCLGDHPEVG